MRGVENCRENEEESDVQREWERQEIKWWEGQKMAKKRGIETWMANEEEKRGIGGGENRKGKSQRKWSEEMEKIAEDQAGGVEK